MEESVWIGGILLAMKVQIGCHIIVLLGILYQGEYLFSGVGCPCHLILQPCRSGGGRARRRKPVVTMARRVGTPTS